MRRPLPRDAESSPNPCARPCADLIQNKTCDAAATPHINSSVKRKLQNGNGCMVIVCVCVCVYVYVLVHTCTLTYIYTLVYVRRQTINMYIDLSTCLNSSEQQPPKVPNRCSHTPCSFASSLAASTREDSTSSESTFAASSGGHGL